MRELEGKEDRAPTENGSVVEGEVRLCDLKECFDAQHTKLTISMRGVAIRPSVMRALEEINGVYKPGRAPRNGLERQIQEALEDLEDDC